VAVGHLVLGQRGAAAGTPRHHAVAAGEQATVVADLEEVPDVFDVDERVGAVRPGPVGPLPEADGLPGDDVNELRDPGLAAIGEAIDLRGDLLLPHPRPRLLLLDLDLDPEAVAVEAGLPAEP